MKKQEEEAMKLKVKPCEERRLIHFYVDATLHLVQQFTRGEFFRDHIADADQTEELAAKNGGNLP
jgi:hypothetical protein